MKKFFLTAITLLPTLLVAQNGVTISGLSVGAGSVTFNMSWDKPAPASTLTWSDTVWVFVDYNEGGVMKRLPLLTAGATLTSHTPGVGRVEVAPDNNDRGVWIVGNARTTSSFSATVVLPFAGSNVSGACAYASNYPPLGTWIDNGTLLILSGTPPYTLYLQRPAGTLTVVSGGTYLQQAGVDLLSFTDATGAPGLVNCTPPTAPESLTASTSTICSGTSATLTVAGGSEGSKSQFEWGTGTVGVGGMLTTSTTYSATPTSTTTYWVRRVSTDGCGTTTAVTRTITVNALPTTTSLTASTASICNGSAATLTAVGVSAASYSFDNGVTWQTTTTKNVTPTANTTYTLKVLSAESCMSSDSKTATITVTPTNTITWAYGSTNTSATYGVAITDIVYTTTGATDVSATGLPSGVTASFGSSTVTISGTPLAAGTFNYTVTLTGGCGTVSASGKITVVVTTPPGAKTTTTWVVGSQTWSDFMRLAVPGCTSTSSLYPTNPAPAQYREGNAAYGYYYNWTCVNSYGSTLCPSPWRVPSSTDFITLDIALGGTGLNNQITNGATRYNGPAWGGQYGGYANESTIQDFGVNAHYWTTTPTSDVQAVYVIHRDADVFPAHPGGWKYNGFVVRCVK